MLQLTWLIQIVYNEAQCILNSRNQDVVHLKYV